MAPTAVQGEHTHDREDGDQLNVDLDRVHLIVTPTELKIVVGALRSVGDVKLAERFEAVLRQFG
jgi:hypothetical protein